MVTKIHESADIRRNVTIEGNIEIGENAKIGPQCILSGSVKIGRWVNLVGASHLYGDIKVGDFSLFAQGVCISTMNHNYKKVCINNRFHRLCLGKGGGLTSTGPVRIDEDVWVGWRVTVLDDVNVGRGAIIGSGAVVTKDVEPYSIVGGVPARHIKYRFTPDTIDYLEGLKWWTWSNEKLKQNADTLFNRSFP